MKIVLQDGIKDCGVCCLLSIIKFYNGKVSKEYLRDLTNTTKNGVSALSLVEAAEKLGFTVEALKGELEQIDANNLPCIAHVIIKKTYQHFVVIYDINYERKKLTIMDPAKGKRTLSFAEFKLMTSNNYLFLSPVNKLPNYNYNRVIIKTIISFIKKEKKYIVFLFILTIFYFFFNIISSYHFKYLIDYCLDYNVSNNLYILSIIILFIYILKEIAASLRKIILLKYSQIFDECITIKTFKQLILLPYLYYKNRTTGEVVSRIKDLSTIKEYLSIILLFMTTDFMSIFIFIILLFNLSKNLSIISLLLLFSLIIISLAFKNNLKNKTSKLTKEEEKLNSLLIESLSNVDVIKGMHIEFETLTKFKNQYRNFISNVYSLSITSEWLSFMRNNINNIFLVIILYFGCNYIINLKLTLSDLVVFQSILNFYIASFNSLISLISDFPKFKVAVERVEDLFTIKKEEFEGSNYYQMYHLDGVINYHNLTYRCNNKTLLNHINLIINPGDKIFLYGPSGAGKSTIVKLLLRYIEVPFNVITINDIDINHYHLDVLRQNITYVSQQELLYNDTIYNNVKLYHECSSEEIEKVMKLTMVDDIALKTKLVEENGFNFSGGERQRIILARSILKKSDIYIFDEAFSQIDVVREKKILLNIFKYLKNKTIIVISHRFDNKNLFDRIISLNNGILHEEKL